MQVEESARRWQRLRVGWDFLRGLALVVGIYLLGMELHRFGVPIPGGVLGLLLFYAALLSGVVKLAWVERAAGVLLRHMVLLFVPLTVGLIDMGKVISRQAGAIVASLLVSFLAVLLTTGLLGKWLLSGAASEHAAEAGGGQAEH